MRKLALLVHLCALAACGPTLAAVDGAALDAAELRCDACDLGIQECAQTLQQVLGPARPCSDGCAEDAYALDPAASREFFACWIDALHAYEECTGDGVCDSSCARPDTVCEHGSETVRDALATCSSTCD